MKKYYAPFVFNYFPARYGRPAPGPSAETGSLRRTGHTQPAPGGVQASAPR
jgi:hypothetical protein